MGFLVPCASGARAEDWPTYQHDNRRSGITSERLTLPLHEQWRAVPAHRPRPAWPTPAQDDLWHHMYGLSAAVTYDRAYHVTSVGDRLWYGTSADDQVVCRDAKTGRVVWRFFAEGPIRLSPTHAAGRLYVGSDDGCLYCLGASDGKLIWRRRLVDTTRVLPGNGRLISPCPIRTGPVVQDGKVYCAAGLFPNEGVVLAALKADDGSVVWKHQVGISPQGYLLASPQRGYAPTGRTSPVVFDLGSGKVLGQVESSRGEGGTFALLVEDTLYHGPGEGSRIAVGNVGSRDRIASFDGLRMLAGPRFSYLLQATPVVEADGRAKIPKAERRKRKTDLVAFDRERGVAIRREFEMLREKERGLAKQIRKLRGRTGSKEGLQLQENLAEVRARLKQIKSNPEAYYVWRQPCEHRYALIQGGDMLFAGGEGEVAAYATKDGRRVWTAKVQGRASGLAVANGRLFVSTDDGVIHCFAAGEPSTPAAGEQPGDEDTAVEAADDDLARFMLAKAGTTKGYAVVLGLRDGQLAESLARGSDLHVVAIDDDAARIARVRSRLASAELYGPRVAILNASLEAPPLTDYVANLVVSERADRGIPTSPDEIHRILRPGNGVAMLGRPAAAEPSVDGVLRGRLTKLVQGADTGDWKIVDDNGLWAICRRDPLEGGCDWTHMYANPSNTSNSGDEALTGTMRLQWFGEPGPRNIVDRHHRNVAPLVRDGRAIIPGDNRLMAVDAYNGAPLWSKEIPNSRRLGAPFDGGNMAVAPDWVYLAVEDRCLALDARTGDLVTAHGIPDPIRSGERHWGYVAVVDDLLLGSSHKPEATYTDISYGADSYQWGDFKRMVTSEELFAKDRRTGKLLWRYAGGVIISPSLCVGGGRVYVVQARNPQAARDDDGQVNMIELTQRGVTLVALDLKTGKPVWHASPDMGHFSQIVYLMYADEMLVAFGTFNKDKQLWQELIGIDASSGRELWRGNRPTGWPHGGTHGEQVRHPVIVGSTIYAEAHAYDLKTGRHLPDFTFRHTRRGCGAVTASAERLYFRDAFPSYMDLADLESIPLSRVSRPGCWVNIIPACGLVVIPEGSSGCTCGYPIQTSMALAPAPRATR